MLDVECWMLDVGCWMLDVGCWMLDVGRWMLDVGRWLWTLNVGRWTLTLGVGQLYVEREVMNCARGRQSDPIWKGKRITEGSVPITTPPAENGSWHVRKMWDVVPELGCPCRRRSRIASLILTRLHLHNRSLFHSHRPPPPLRRRHSLPAPLHHRPYILTLPSLSDLPTSPTFTPAELALVRGTNLYHATLDRVDELRAEWERTRDGVCVSALRECRDGFSW
jgi:hypothetical protein